MDERDTDVDSADTGVDEQATDTVRVWLVGRTYSDDEQNIIILTYATPDGTRSFRKERALTSFTGTGRETTAAVDVAVRNLSTVDETALREQYGTEAKRMAAKHDSDDTI